MLLLLSKAVSTYLPNFAVDPVKKVILASSDLEKSISYWSGLLQMQVYEKSESKAILGFAEDQAKLELLAIGKLVYIEAKEGFIHSGYGYRH